jgi:hypothetical protein
MNNIYNRQRLLEAIDDYLLDTPVAPGFTFEHLNSTKDLMRFIVLEQNEIANTFSKIFHQRFIELSEWERVLNKENDLGYTLLAMQIQKDLRRYKDVCLLQISG